MNLLKIAIQILNYKNVKVIINTLNSLNSIANQKLEIFILDNGSGDEIFRELRSSISFPNLDIKLFKSKKNLGFTGGHNYLTKQILKNNLSYDYFLLLNSDCILEKDFFKKLSMSKQLICKKTLVFGFSTYSKKSLKYSHSFGFWNKFTGLSSNEQFIKKSSLGYGVYYPNGNAIILKNSFYKNIGYLDEDLFFYGDEVDIAMRLDENNYKFQVLKHIKTFHDDGASIFRSGENRTFFSDYYSIRCRLLLIYKYYPKNILLVKFFTLLVFIKRLISCQFLNSLLILKLLFSNRKKLLHLRYKYAEH
jgi:GT2 family glycosyltransferase